MNKITFTLLVASSLGAIQLSSAATIPAGATLIVRTTETVSSDDPVGKTFGTELYRDVVVGGKVLLHAGTRVIGRVASSRTFASTPVILDITQVSIRGQMVRIKTRDGFRADGSRFKTRRGVSVGRGGFFQLPTGTIMQFQLAQLVNLASHTGKGEVNTDTHLILVLGVNQIEDEGRGRERGGENEDEANDKLI